VSIGGIHKRKKKIKKKKEKNIGPGRQRSLGYVLQGPVSVTVTVGCHIIILYYVTSSYMGPVSVTVTVVVVAVVECV